MNNFYELFNVTHSATKKDILLSYQLKINQFNNCTKLTNSQIYDIKMLKIGLYILTNDDLRYKYDQSLIQPKPNNDNYDNNIDSVFNIDNSWMKNIKINNDDKINFGDRVFSLSDMNKRPGFSSEFENTIRKPLQGREEKK